MNVHDILDEFYESDEATHAMKTRDDVLVGKKDVLEVAQRSWDAATEAYRARLIQVGTGSSSKKKDKIKLAKCYQSNEDLRRINRNYVSQMDDLMAENSALTAENKRFSKFSGEKFLMHVCDIVWQTAYEDESVPSTDMRKEMIKKAKKTFKP